MGKHEKLLQKALNNPGGLSFNEFETLMKQCNWVCDRQKGSHKIWYSPKKHRISVQDRKGKVKEYQVKQFLVRYEEEAKNA